MDKVWEGIIIGGAGGAVAGLTILLVQYMYMKALECVHKRRVYNWLKAHISAAEGGKRFRSTKTIASWNNLTEDRVRYICSIHEKIYLSTGEQEDRWSLHEVFPRNL
jgi:hypothetical protein